MDAAGRLFVDAGYVATSVRAIAREAGVAEKTVYLQFETKPAILKAVVESAIVGSDDPVPAARSPWFLEVLAESRLERKVELLSAATSALHERTGAVFAVAREAATVDPAGGGAVEQGKARPPVGHDHHGAAASPTRASSQPPSTSPGRSSCSTSCWARRTGT